MSEHAAAICLNSCGDCARQASDPKYLSVKTDEPPSDAPASSLGLWISTKPRASKNSRKMAHTADEMRMMAALAGVRRSIHRLSSRVSAFTSGNGGGASAPDASAARISSCRAATTASEREACEERGEARGVAAPRARTTRVTTRRRGPPPHAARPSTHVFERKGQQRRGARHDVRGGDVQRDVALADGEDALLGGRQRALEVDNALARQREEELGQRGGGGGRLGRHGLHRRHALAQRQEQEPRRVAHARQPRAHEQRRRRRRPRRRQRPAQRAHARPHAPRQRPRLDDRQLAKDVRVRGSRLGSLGGQRALALEDAQLRGREEGGE